MAVWTRLEREPRKQTPFFRIASEPTLKMEEQIRQIRERIKSQIPGTINGFLETVGSTTIRILGDTPNSVLDIGGYSWVPYADSRQRSRIRFVQGMLDANIANTLATMHNGHGHDPLPLVDDCNDAVLQYKNPRNLFSR
ncbi:uncharacterized protein N7518_006151 [Penicillium psychrosexuale]|uniref:uncharacterized protein n=1 Tax=Penicillium psychrosexuale TaxID=1002107 RepID=UPI002545B6CA|nr:uncharacterized protein N7518_006151 [Penicillium psychrosexuale]KAJ5789140.1 hypothetical protein N7518_006151 [Penicillium psychrosexuale]